ncbi:MAG: hypothetical protein Q4F84_05655 [Fibrobacter sp.]|nr:hypothetical protein [Fibrobacter sp.]
MSKNLSLMFEVNTSIVIKGIPSQTITMHYRYKFYDDCMLRTEPLDTSNSESRTSMLQAVNPRYLFVLTSDDILTSSWRVSKIEKIEDPARITSFPDLKITGTQLYEAQSSYCSRFPGLNTMFCFLPSMFAAPGFHLKDAVSVEEDGMKLMKISYSYEPVIPKKNNIVRGGELFLMEEHDWMIKKGWFECEESGSKTRPVVSIQNKYDFLSDSSFPRLLSSKKTVTGGTEDKSTNTSIYSWQKNEETDKNVFTLSHYGLPEPDFEIRRGRFSALRYGLMAIGFALVLYAGYRICTGKRKKTISSDGE